MSKHVVYYRPSSDMRWTPVRTCETKEEAQDTYEYMEGAGVDPKRLKVEKKEND